MDSFSLGSFMKNQHDHVVPLIGGPLCGDSVTLSGKILPHTLPMIFERKLCYYSLVVNEKIDSTEVYYEYYNMGNEDEVS